MRGRLSRSVRALYTCGTARKHKRKVGGVVLWILTMLCLAVPSCVETLKSISF
jgi:hypothetical protein